MSDTGYQGETITVQLPAMDFTEEVARAGRVMQAAQLAGELTPLEFAQWIAHGKAIMDIRPSRAQGKGEAPDAQAGEHVA
jgi:hypothetical protein